MEFRKGHGKERRWKRVGECGDVRVWGVGEGRWRKRKERGERRKEIKDK